MEMVEQQGVTRRKKRKRRTYAAMFLYCFRGVVQPRLSNINNKELCKVSFQPWNWI